MFLLCFLLLAIVGCALKSASSETITMQAWLNEPNPEVVLFWPPPLNGDVLMGPKLVSGKTNHIFMFYGDRSGASPTSFTLYVSNSTDFPVDFGRNKADTAVQFEQIEIAGQQVPVEVLTRRSLPNQGIATFSINKSQVVIQWNHADEETVLGLLANNLIHISANDSAQIIDIENYLIAQTQ